MISRKMLRAKIHGAQVTHADVAYEGSITIPPYLMEASGLVPYEAVNVWDVTNGARLETYAITGREGSAEISINGAAAHLVHPGDTVIIAAFVQVPENEVATFKPKLVFVDRQNQIKDISKEIPGPQKRVE